MSVAAHIPHHNLLGYSNFSASGWTRNCTVTDVSASVAIPEHRYGVVESIQMSAASAQAITFANSGYSHNHTSNTYRLSMYAKYNNHQWIGFGITGAGTHVHNFDIQNGVAGTATAGAVLTNPTIEDVGQGWYYMTCRMVGGTYGPIFRFVIQLQNASAPGAYSVTGSEIIYVSSPQIQVYVDSSAEWDKYIETVDYHKAWGPARPFLADANKYSNGLKVQNATIAKSSSPGAAQRVFFRLYNSITGAGVTGASGSFTAVTRPAGAGTGTGYSSAGGTFNETAYGNYSYTPSAAEVQNEGIMQLVVIHSGSETVHLFADVVDPARLVWTQDIEGNYSAGSAGDYLEHAKKYTSNRLTEASDRYTVYDDDGSTVYEQGDSTSSTREPD